MKRLLALKLFLTGKNAAFEVYELLGVSEEFSLWQQLQRTWGDLKPERLVSFYEDLPPAAIEKKWFVKLMLQIKHNIDVEERLRELQKQKLNQEEERERQRRAYELEMGARETARLQEAERDPAGKPQFNPNVIAQW